MSSKTGRNMRIKSFRNTFPIPICSASLNNWPSASLILGNGCSSPATSQDPSYTSITLPIADSRMKPTRSPSSTRKYISPITPYSKQQKTTQLPPLSCSTISSHSQLHQISLGIDTTSKPTSSSLTQSSTPDKSNTKMGASNSLVSISFSM